MGRPKKLTPPVAKPSAAQMAAVEDLMRLHSMLAKSFTEVLASGQATAADRAAASRFLQSNYVVRQGPLPTAPRDAAQHLDGFTLPTFEDDEKPEAEKLADVFA